MNQLLTQLAMKWLRRQIHKDEGLALAWHCNLAVCGRDEGMDWAASQRAAGRFMSLLFGRDTCSLPVIKRGIVYRNNDESKS